MKCSVKGCEGEYVKREIVHKMQYGEQIFSIEHVPAQVCTECGDVLIDANTLRDIDKILQTKVSPKYTVTRNQENRLQIVGRKLREYILVILAFCAVLLIVGAIGAKNFPAIDAMLKAMRAGETITQTEYGATVVERIKALEELSTVQFYSYTVVKQHEKQDKLWVLDFGLLDEELEILMLVPATIKAGIDFKHAIVNQTSIEGKKAVYIHFPAPQPRNISCELDLENRFTMINSRHKSDQEIIQMFGEVEKTAKAQLKAEALNAGILQKAEENARVTLTQFLQELGYTEITIVFGDTPIIEGTLELAPTDYRTIEEGEN